MSDAKPGSPDSASARDVSRRDAYREALRESLTSDNEVHLPVASLAPSRQKRDPLPDALLRRAFAAIWEEQLDLADPEVLIRLADESGLPGRQLVERAASAEIGAAYAKNQQEAQAADVFGSPAYVLRGEVFWGQDRIELLADALQSKRAPYTSEV